MVGWHISAFRQAKGALLPARPDSAKGARVAVWQAGPYGLNWMSSLAKAGLAVDYGGGGYPRILTARARDILPVILAGPPDMHERWVLDLDSAIVGDWPGQTVINKLEANQCPPEEWLLIVAWDES